MIILSLARFVGGWCGVNKNRFSKFLERTGWQRYLQDMIDSGHLRKEIIEGKEVLFPTEKLLQSQNVPMRTHSGVIA